MSLAVEIAAQGVRVPIGRARAADVVRGVLRAERVPHALVSVTFLSRRRIAAMNRRHLRHHGPTDVISFGFRRATPTDPVVGDVYIAPDIARINAAANGVGIREELVRLIVHGVLHVLGYDHPDGPSRTHSPMWRRQEQLVRRATRDRITR